MPQGVKQSVPWLAFGLTVHGALRLANSRICCPSSNFRLLHGDGYSEYFSAEPPRSPGNSAAPPWQQPSSKVRTQQTKRPKANLTARVQRSAKQAQSIAKPHSSFNPTEPRPRSPAQCKDQKTKLPSDFKTPTSPSPKCTCFVRMCAVILQCTFCKCQSTLLRDIQILLRGSWKSMPPNRQRLLMRNGIVRKEQHQILHTIAEITPRFSIPIQ